MSTVTATATDNVITVDNENCAIDPVTSVEVVTVSVEPVTLEVTQLFSGVSPVPAGGGSGQAHQFMTAFGRHVIGERPS